MFEYFPPIQMQKSKIKKYAIHSQCPDSIRKYASHLYQKKKANISATQQAKSLDFVDYKNKTSKSYFIFPGQRSKRKASPVQHTSGSWPPRKNPISGPRHIIFSSIKSLKDERNEHYTLYVPNIHNFWFQS